MEKPTPYDDFVPVPAATQELAHRVIGMAIAVHRELGPGLPEEAYETALCIELAEAGIPFERQYAVKVAYKGIVVATVRIDLLIDSRLVVEVKSVDGLNPIHRSQTTRYLHILMLPLGLLLNFNVPVLKDGIRRIIRTQP